MSAEASPAKTSSARKCKIVFLGDSSVGKTSLINQYMYNQFTLDFETTIGIDYFTKSMEYSGTKYTLQIWDTAGQEQYKSLIPSYIRDASVEILVFDVNRPASFENVHSWYKEVLNHHPNSPTCVLVGNKNDLESNIDEQLVQKYANDNNMELIYTSARTGENVPKIFELAVSKIVTEEPPQPSLDLKAKVRPAEKAPDSTQSSCC